MGPGSRKAWKKALNKKKWQYHVQWSSLRKNHQRIALKGWDEFQWMDGWIDRRWKRKHYDPEQRENNHNWNTFILIQAISLVLFVYCLALQFDLAKVKALYLFPFSFHIQVSYPIQVLPPPSAWSPPHVAQLLWEGSRTSSLSEPRHRLVSWPEFSPVWALVSAFPSLKNPESFFTTSASNTALQRSKLL